jgi:hypothetical protein
VADSGQQPRDVLAVEPLTLVKALRLATEDPAADVQADEAKSAEWADIWKKNWDRRFGRQLIDTK